MSKEWLHYNPVRIHFGRGIRRVLNHKISGKRCLFFTSKRGYQKITEDPVMRSIQNATKFTWVDSINSYPSLDSIQEITNAHASEVFDYIIGWGGGSVIDTAKSCSIALAPELKGMPLDKIISAAPYNGLKRKMPVISIPTTAGTGTEVTPYATIWDNRLKKKLSLYGESLYSSIAIIDSELTDDLPMDVALSTGLDAINQAVESIWNKNATPITLNLAERSLLLGFNALPKLISGEARSVDYDDMAECSMLAGMAISQTKTALCHSIGYPLTAHFSVPHGLACAFTMTAVLKVNMQVDDGRMDKLRQTLGCEDLIEAFQNLTSNLGVLNEIKKYIGSVAELEPLIGDMYLKDRADNNLAPVNESIIRQILIDSWS